MNLIRPSISRRGWGFIKGEGYALTSQFHSHQPHIFQEELRQSAEPDIVIMLPGIVVGGTVDGNQKSGEKTHRLDGAKTRRK